MKGCCTYGLPPQHNCMLLCGEQNKKNVIELNRLIKEDGMPKNTQSWFVAQTFKLLPKPMIILSYADPNNGHNGYTYQSLNFLYTGKSNPKDEYIFENNQHTERHINKNWILKKGGLWNDDLTINENFINLGGKILKQKPKNRYVYFNANKKQKKLFFKELKWDILSYPKQINKNYDTSHKTTTQIELF